MVNYWQLGWPARTLLVPTALGQRQAGTRVRQVLRSPVDLAGHVGPDPPTAQHSTGDVKESILLSGAQQHS